MNILDIQRTLERALFGMTAEEAVERRLALIDKGVKRALDRLAAGLEEDSDSAPEDQDQAADNASGNASA